MGFFGGPKSGGATAGVKLDPSQMSKSDKLMMLGATLRDMGAGLNHEEGNSIANLQNMLIARQMRAGQLSALQDMMGGPTQTAPAPTVATPTGPLGAAMNGASPSRGPMPNIAPQPTSPQPASPYQYNLPQRGAPMTIDDPRALPTMMKYGMMGGDAKTAIEILKAQQPNWAYDNGVGYRTNGGASQAGVVHTKLGEGQTATYGPNGQANQITNVPGYVAAAAGSAGATTGAQEQAKAGWDLVDVPVGGKIVKLPRAVAAPLLTSAFSTANGGNLPANFGQGQTPGEKAADEASGVNPNVLETHDVGGVPTTKTRAQWLAQAEGVPAPQAPGAAAQGAAAPTGPLTGQAMFQAFTGPHEGGFNAHDLNGAPVNMGFNQKANPDIDVSKLTPAQASQRFVDKYWTPSGADRLPPALAAVHADTYFMNPGKATQILAQSGGDPNKYMALREQWLNNIVATNPNAQKYAKAWGNRNADLRAFSQQYADQPAGAEQGAPQAAVGPPGIRGLNKADETKLATYMEDARTAEDVVQKAHQFQQLNTQQASGPGYKPFNVTLPFMRQPVDINVPGALAKQFQTGVPAMNNLSMQLATGLRAPGQRLTQQEIMMNLKSVPGLTNTPNQNDMLVGDMEQRATTKRAYANFMSDWLRSHGSLQGADETWSAQTKSPTGGKPAPAPVAASAPPPKGTPAYTAYLKAKYGQ